MPVDQPPLIPGAGPRPFRSRDDVIAHLDEILLGSGDLAPIRDALLDALIALLYQLQFRGEFAIAQCDLLRATEQYLTSIGGDDRGVPRAPNEGQEAYRARLLATPQTVTEAAIVLGVNLILAPFTSTQCQLFDGILDRWFVRSDPAEVSWRSFVGNSPEYPDRLYSGQEALNGGLARPNSDPGGARVFKTTLGRMFILRLPDLSSLSEPPGVNADADAVPLSPKEFGFFVGQTFTADHAAFVNKSATAPLAVYQAIESFVNSVVGQSIRWGFSAELEAA
jgi:hypothetical protein